MNMPVLDESRTAAVFDTEPATVLSDLQLPGRIAIVGPRGPASPALQSVLRSLRDDWSCTVVGNGMGNLDHERRIIDGCDTGGTVVALLTGPSVAAQLSTLKLTALVVERLAPRRLLAVVPAGIHFGCRWAEQLESIIAARWADGVSRLTLVRVSPLVDDQGRLVNRRACGAWCGPFLSDRITAPVVAIEELGQVLADEIDSPPAVRRRTITLLGARQSWRDVVQRPLTGAGDGWPLALLESLCLAARWTGLHALIRFVLILAARFLPSLRPLVQETLHPESNARLLSLLNRHNARHVRIAGCNNGVRHFGWTFPRRTVVTTTHLPPAVRVCPGRLQASAGATLKTCIARLRESGQELLVVPNYSWISAGTVFHVPVHGSGCAVSTLGDSIERVLCFDADREQFVQARRGDPEFRDLMYRRDDSLLTLRVEFRVRPAARYQRTTEVLTGLSAEDLLSALHCPDSTNVEIRKNRAAADEVTIHRWSEVRDELSADAEEVPRDSLGRLWDRLEETPVAGRLFHWFVRRFGFHVELFLTPSQLTTFWTAHRTLPVSKLQLRLVRRDGMTHSPCRDQDLVSVDLFTLRRHRERLTSFLKSELPGARTNPGKQSL
jgi:hypothetical protein